MEDIKSILDKATKRLGLKKKVKQGEIFLNWEEIVGEELAKHTNPGFLRNGILFINVPSSVWSHHLTLMKNKIIKKINEELKKNIVKDIRFRCGDFVKFGQEDDFNINDINNKNNYQRKDLKNIKLNNEEKDKIKSIIKDIEDPLLKKKLEKLLLIDIKNKKWMKNEKYSFCPICKGYYKSKWKICVVCKNNK